MEHCSSEAIGASVMESPAGAPETLAPEESAAAEVGDPNCWYCNGVDSAACPMCNPSDESEDKPNAIKAETNAVLGQDGWHAPEGDRFGPPPATESISNSLEAPNMKILCKAEDCLQNGNVQKALELAVTVLKNIDAHMTQLKGQVDFNGSSLVKRGEMETLCLGCAVVARCYFCAKRFEAGMEQVKKFSSLYEMVVDAGDPARLHKLEKDLLEDCSPNAAFVTHLFNMSAAAEILLTCRERVKNGYAPKIVMDNSQKAIEGLRPMCNEALPGLNFLRAGLHCVRAHAALELEMWDEAMEDADLALLCDPDCKEAEYMKECAENQEW